MSSSIVTALTIDSHSPILNYYLLNAHFFPHVASSMWPFSRRQSPVPSLAADKIIIPLPPTPPLTKKVKKNPPAKKGRLRGTWPNPSLRPSLFDFSATAILSLRYVQRPLKRAGVMTTQNASSHLLIFIFAQTTRADRRSLSLLRGGRDELKWDWLTYKGKCSCLRGRDAFMLPLFV